MKQQIGADLAAEALLAVIAVPSGLLTERRQTVTDNLMAHAPVADEADSERAMLNDGFVTPLDDTPDELLCTSVRDFVHGLVASAPCGFDGGQEGLIFGSVDKLHRRFNDFHFYSPFLAVLGNHGIYGYTHKICQKHEVQLDRD